MTTTPPIPQTDLLAWLDRAEKGDCPDTDWSSLDYSVLRYLVANTPPVAELDAPAEFTAMTIVRNGEASHTVADVEPDSFIDLDEENRRWWGDHNDDDQIAVCLHNSGQKPILVQNGDYAYLNPDETRRLASRLLSAAARAERRTPVQDSGQRVQDTDQDGEGISDAVLVGLLGFVGVTATPVLVASWTPGQRQDAARWASCTHRAASGVVVDVPDRPAFLAGG